MANELDQKVASAVAGRSAAAAPKAADAFQNVHAIGVYQAKNGDYHVRIHVHTADFSRRVAQELGLEGSGGNANYKRMFHGRVVVDIYALPPAVLLVGPPTPPIPPAGPIVLAPGDPLRPLGGVGGNSTLGYFGIDAAGQAVPISTAHGFLPYTGIGGGVTNCVPGAPIVATLSAAPFGGNIDASGFALAVGIGYAAAIPGVGGIGLAVSLDPQVVRKVEVVKVGYGSGLTTGDLNLSPPTYTVYAPHPTKPNTKAAFHDQYLVVRKSGDKKWLSRPGDSGAAAVVREPVYRSDVSRNRVIGLLWCGDNKTGSYYYVCHIDPVKAALKIVAP